MAKKTNRNQLELFTVEEMGIDMPIDIKPQWHYSSADTTERLNEVEKYNRSISLNEYCEIIKHWILKNTSVVSVVEWYQDDTNSPFEYPFDEVISNESIKSLLDERIKLMALKGQLKSQVFATLKGDKKETPIDNQEKEMKFEIR